MDGIHRIPAGSSNETKRLTGDREDSASILARMRGESLAFVNPY
jgi:hypothetical protein